MIADIFSKRDQPFPDLYVYDVLPLKLRTQVALIFQEDIGHNRSGEPDFWADIAKVICREHGLLALPSRPSRSDRDDCANYVLQQEVVPTLDMIDHVVRVLDLVLRPKRHQRYGVVAVDTVIDELNHRFRENACGYVYQREAHKLVRVDSQLLHAEAVKPALKLISGKEFASANKEFLAAHDHYRHDRTEAAITEACKAFESTMKAICAARGWTHDPGATARPLIDLLVTKGLVKGYSREQLEYVSKCLIGAATIRNKDAGHGAGAAERDLPEHFAAYALHLAASNIVFLVECHKSMPL